MGNFDFDFSTKSIVLTFSIDVKITISNNLGIIKEQKNTV